jgi:hypothetical protein
MPLKTLSRSALPGSSQSSGYTPVGAMDRQIDIWDQPPNLMPVLIAAGVQAQIATKAPTTVSPASTELGQKAVWPRITGQECAAIPHLVTIRYMAGLKSRMFFVYNDPDNGARRFDFDRIIDPDEKKVELQILAIERMDGKDAFDALLNTTADVLIRDTSAGDSRGMSSPAYTILATAIACRVQQDGGTPAGKEVRAKAKSSLDFQIVFMRPWFSDPAPNGSFFPYVVVAGVTYNTHPLTHNHWLLIPSASVVNSNGQATPGDMYDISDINNPGAVNHHLQLDCQLVKP